MFGYAPRGNGGTPRTTATSGTLASDRQEPIDLDRLGLPLQLDGAQRLDGGPIAQLIPREGADHDPAGDRDGLEPSGHVRRVPDRAERALRFRADAPDHR